MSGLVSLLILLAVVWLLSGPVALIVALTALRRLEQMRRELYDRAMRPPTPPPEATVVRHEPVDLISEDRPAPPEAAPVEFASEELPAPPIATVLAGSDHVVDRPFYEAVAEDEEGGLEQRIGTRWVLVAGVITVIFAVGYFLKYAYEHQWIGPLGRVAIAWFGGLAALAVGEITRRRGYDFVAKGVTALGFAILYATVFAAHRWYGLIGPAPAYVLAIMVTVSAMAYAVVLNEVAIALLSLAGGYLTPVVLSTGENQPNLLFGYVLILSTGAMLCAYWRKWGAVNLLTFLGTYLLYTLWFERFYRPQMAVRWPPEQLGVALFWLSVFFAVFLVLPVLHTLLRRVKSQIQDVLLVLANAAMVFYYLWTMLADRQDWLALCSLAMGVVYLGLMGLVSLRYRADADLHNVLLIAGLVFLSLAVPLYFEAYTIAIVWAVEAVVLAAIGIRYRSTLVQIAAAAVIGLAVGTLAMELPLHTTPFRLFLNPAFGSWAFVAAALLAGHALYRMDRRLDATVREGATEMLYVAGLLLLLIALGMELWLHYLNVERQQPDLAFFGRHMTLVLSLFLLLFAIRPLRPPGALCSNVAAALGVAGSVFLVLTYPHFHRGAFTLFANFEFLRALVLAAVLFIGSALVRRGDPPTGQERTVAPVLALTGVLLLWILMTQEVWFYYERRGGREWYLPAHMSISILWAVYATVLMVIGFWRRVRPLRYIALGIFLLLLAKIFLVDTRTVETIYRIAGFFVTGLTLVGVSYLYQYLKKKGFFEPAR